MCVRFGAAGNSDSFYKQGNKSSLEMPAWLAKQGLSAYEYPCSRGVRIKEDFARKLGEKARDNDIALSIHAPYYISLSSEDSEIKQKTRGHILKSMWAARWMGADVVVLHPGGGPGEDRVATYKRAKINLAEILKEAADEGLSSIKLAPETMGKINQIGSLDEILDICTVADNVVPCVDFGHLYAVSLGGLTTKESFALVLDKIAVSLGAGVLENLHIHFSPVEFTKAGERKHRTTVEEGFGPDFTPLAELIAERGIQPRVICESRGRQAEDALVYKRILDSIEKYS